MKKLIILIVVILSVISCSSKSGTDLIEAVKANDFEKVKRIADTKNVNMTDETGATPVMWAAYNGNVEMLDFLVKQGADVRKKGIMGINTNDIPKTYTNAIIAAAGEGHLEAVKYLVEKVGISPDEKGDCLNDFQILPQDVKTTDGLIDFVKESKGKVFDYFRENGHYNYFLTSYKQTYPYFLCWILNELINSKDLVNEIPDSYAFRRVVTNRKEMDKIFEKFINPVKEYSFIKKSDMETALSTASFYGREEIVLYLISKGADVNFMDCEAIFPLMAAAIKQEYKIIEILLKNGAEKKVVTAPFGEKVSILSQLLMGYLESEQKENFKKNLSYILPFLWKSEKDIIESSTDVYPHPLLEPCLYNDSELVKIMMENGADYSKIEYKGRTLKDICKENGIEIKDEWLKKKDK